MLIGELSSRSGLSKDTIRFYEKHGLIAISRKERRENNYKEYSDEVLNRLLTIKLIKGFGFTLNETSDLLDLMEINQATCNNVEGKIRSKIELLDSKIKELIDIRTMLIKGVSNCSGTCNPEKPEENCQILVSETKFKN